MKVIICGAGQVGSNIAAYLSEEDNEVTLIDTSAELISQVNENLDVSGIVGFASHPDVLEEAGARDAELIIAATHCDEVNMVACQVAHSIFNVPKKIARVRNQTYLDPLWANLFSREHMPIDFVISPEVEVADAILNRVKAPGAFNIIPIAEGRAQFASVICQEDCPVINTAIRHIPSLFPDLNMKIVAIIRGQKKIIPTSLDEMYPGDEVSFVTETEHLSRTLAAFGHEEGETRRIIIVGSGHIGLKLAENIEKKSYTKDIRVRLIEADPERAKYASENLISAIVIHGDGLDRTILEEAKVDKSEAIITITNHDETNVLTSLLAKEYGCKRAITLINNSTYIPLVSSLGIDAVVNPRAITVSTILQHIRRGRIKAAHSLRDGFAELIEIEALETSAVVNTPLKLLKLPDDIVIAMILRGEEVIIPRNDTVILPADHVIVIAAHDKIKKVEQIFTVRPEYF